ncbi:MAG: hypothetical protein ACSHXF_07725 [Aquaticitalea sp.]
MKYYILTFAIVVFGCKNNPETTTSLESDDKIFSECDSISKQAETDYNNGIREYTTMGLVEATKFEIFYSDFMKQNYNIKIRANCVPTFLSQCYEQSMAFKIEEEYGEDFMQTTREKAKTEFNKMQK